jgi:hypothetical protein
MNTDRVSDWTLLLNEEDRPRGLTQDEIDYIISQLSSGNVRTAYAQYQRYHHIQHLNTQLKNALITPSRIASMTHRIIESYRNNNIIL